MFALCIESSHKRGMGHLYRALNLANALKHAGYSCKFYLNEHLPSQAILEEKCYGYELVNLEDFISGWEEKIIKRDGIKCWVNDRLETEFRHASRLKDLRIPLVTFDDRGTGATLADLHIAALTFDNKEKLAGSKVLHGVEYLILNPEIAKYARLRNQLSSVLVTLGGSDTYGVTVKVVEFLKRMNMIATVVVGPSFMHTEGLNEVLTDRFTLKSAVNSMIEEFAVHDLAITGGGITPFEANASGLPCLVIANESFEIPVGVGLQKLGGSIFLGHYTTLHDPLFQANIRLEEMSRAGMTNVGIDGLNRVTKAILELLI